jgi:PAS domain S-box-containing protein
MLLSKLREWLSGVAEDEASETNETTYPKFVPTKTLCERDYIIIDMLNSTGHEYVSFCVTDPSLPDNPVIYISEGFCNLTGYDLEDVVGKNCRFLQGKETAKEDVERIRDAIENEKDCSVNLLNYKKDGATFINEVSIFASLSCASLLSYLIY